MKAEDYRRELLRITVDIHKTMRLLSVVRSDSLRTRYQNKARALQAERLELMMKRESDYHVVHVIVCPGLETVYLDGQRIVEDSYIGPGMFTLADELGISVKIADLSSKPELVRRFVLDDPAYLLEVPDEIINLFE